MFQATVAFCILCATPGIERDTPSRVIQGEVVCRVLLIDFEGREHVHPHKSFETIFFGNRVRSTPGPFKEPICGSARDYFREISNGQLLVTGEVMPWVRSRLKVENLPHWRTSRDGDRDWWQPVVADAMSQNDIPQDDRIDGKPVNFYAVIYAGPSNGYFKCLGKKTFMGAGRRRLSSRTFRKTKVPFWEDRWNGKNIIFSPERWKDEPSGIHGVGLLFHEMAHQMCGFWDLYAKANGDFGRWAVMAYGEKTHFPTGPTAFHRYMAGWLSYDVPEQQGRHRIKLPPVRMQRAVKLVNGPMPWADSLIVEYRARFSENEKTLPAEGLLVYQAYGRRRVQTVQWDTKANKPAVLEQRIRLLRADNSMRNEAGDVFREGSLTLFGKPSSASSATGCGFWELDNITLPKKSSRRSASRRPATFEAVYCPQRLALGRGNGPLRLDDQLAQGDYRLYLKVKGGPCTVESDRTLLAIPAARNTEPQWGLVDVRLPAPSGSLKVVPGEGASLEEIQAVPRQPTLLDLLAEPHAGQLASSSGGRQTDCLSLDANACVGGAINIPLDKPATATTDVTCPGGVLRLAFRAFTPKRQPAPETTVVITAGDKRYKYLSRAALRTDRPDFFLLDCGHLKGKPIKIALALKGPEGSRVVLWEARFVR